MIWNLVCACSHRYHVQYDEVDKMNCFTTHGIPRSTLSSLFVTASNNESELCVAPLKCLVKM